MPGSRTRTKVGKQTDAHGIRIPDTGSWTQCRCRTVSTLAGNRNPPVALAFDGFYVVPWGN